MGVSGPLALDVAGMFVASDLTEVIFDDQGEMASAQLYGEVSTSLAADVEAKLPGALSYRSSLQDEFWVISVIEEQFRHQDTGEIGRAHV